MPKDGKRAIVRCRDNDFLHPFPDLNLAGCQALHVDGHIPHAALHYAKLCRKHGILTSLDGGAVRENTEELLITSMWRLFLNCSVSSLASHQKTRWNTCAPKGVKVGGVTQGEQGLLWYEDKCPIKRQPALKVPKGRVIDTNGAGDTFHGAYVYAYLADPKGSWEDHFKTARAASAHAIQFLGNEASLPTVLDLDNVQKNFPAGDE